MSDLANEWADFTCDDMVALRAEVDTLREIVRLLDAELLADDVPNGWGHLASLTSTSISHAEAERFGPVIDRAMEAPDEQ